MEYKIEEENQRKIDEIHVQAQEIRNVVERMHEETKESNSYLDRLTSTMEKGKSGLDYTVSKFDEMLADKNKRLSIYIAGSLIVFVVFIWKFIL